MADLLVTLTEANFQEAIEDSLVPVIVDFWSQDCGPCRMLPPILEQLAREKAGSVKIAKVNIDECADLCVQYQVTAVPTLLFFKDGKRVDKVVGLLSKDAIASRLALLA